MKKIYSSPELEIIKLNLYGVLCASEPMNEDGEMEPGTGDPKDPDWGSDY